MLSHHTRIWNRRLIGFQHKIQRSYCLLLENPLDDAGSDLTVPGSVRVEKVVTHLESVAKPTYQCQGWFQGDSVLMNGRGYEPRLPKDRPLVGPVILNGRYIFLGSLTKVGIANIENGDHAMVRSDGAEIASYAFDAHKGCVLYCRVRGSAM